MGGTITYGELEVNKGKVLSLINSYGHGTVASAQGFYPEMIAKLDRMATAFAEKFNEIHKKGYQLDSTTNGEDFFVIDPPATVLNAGTMTVNTSIINDPSKLAASAAPEEEGNGANALLLANMKTAKLPGPGPTGLDNATTQTFYQSMIGQLGVDGEQTNRLTYNSTTIKMAVENNRSSVSSVSLDEEMTNMITYQQAYNASARMITVVDETLDKIINGMGRVGL